MFLDEPTAGLHPKDIISVVENLKRLRDNGNSVIVVEHDETVIKNSDYLIEVGPGEENRRSDRDRGNN